MPKLDYQTWISYQQLLLGTQGMTGIKSASYCFVLISVLELMKPLNMIGRIMLPCPCCEDWISAREVNQCRRCKVFLHQLADGIHFERRDHSNLDRVCIACMTFDGQVAEFRKRNKGN
jgi:hypothetical protein